MAVVAPDLVVAAVIDGVVDATEDAQRGGADTRRHRAGWTVPGAREGWRHRVRTQHLSSGRPTSRGDAVRRRSDQSEGQGAAGGHIRGAHSRHVRPRHLRAQPEPALCQGVPVQHRHQRARVR